MVSKELKMEMEKVKNKSGVYFSTFVWISKKDDNYLESERKDPVIC